MSHPAPFEVVLYDRNLDKRLQLAFSNRSRKNCWTVFYFLQSSAIKNADGENEVRTSWASIGEATGLSRTTIRTSLALLQNRNFIVKTSTTTSSYSGFIIKDEAEWNLQSRYYPQRSPSSKLDIERKKMTNSLRYDVLHRDGFKCALCGKTQEDDKLVVDHIFPISKGGKTELDNLRTLCFSCNSGKRDKLE